MKRARVIVIILLVMLLALWLARTRTYCREVLHDTQLLWNDEELYIVVQRKTVAMRARNLAVLAHGVGAEITSEDLVVFHITENGVAEYEMLGFGLGGSANPFSGQLHFGRGGNPPREWQWTGRCFAELSTQETLKVRSSYQMLDDLFEQEGWHESYWPFLIDIEDTANRLVKQCDVLLRWGEVSVRGEWIRDAAASPQWTDKLLIIDFGERTQALMHVKPLGYEIDTVKYEALKKKVANDYECHE